MLCEWFTILIDHYPKDMEACADFNLYISLFARLEQYWINLLAQGGDPLPIEVQYASQVMGIPGFEGGDVDTDAFMEALLGFEF